MFDFKCMNSLLDTLKVKSCFGIFKFTHFRCTVLLGKTYSLRANFETASTLNHTKFDRNPLNGSRHKTHAPILRLHFISTVQDARHFFFKIMSVPYEWLTLLWLQVNHRSLTAEATVRAGFVVNKMTWGQGFLPVRLFSLVSIRQQNSPHSITNYQGMREGELKMGPW